MCSLSHPYAVWRYDYSGRTLLTFEDSDLAAKFVIRNGGEVIANPCNW